MSKVALSGSALGTGTFTIASPNSNVDRTLSLPDASGTVQVSGNPISGTTGTFSGAVQASGVATNIYPIVSGTAVASTSGTSIDFTGIPSWVKRITVMFSGVSTNGTSNYIVQIGSGSITTTGYLSGSSRCANGAVGYSTYTTGFGLNVVAVADFCSGSMVLTNISGNSWVSAHALYTTSVALGGGGNLSLSGTLDRIRITTVNGTDTFDAGSINILYE